MSKQRQIFSKTNFPWKKNFFFGSEYAETHYIKSFFRKSEKKSNISTHFRKTTSKGWGHTVYTGETTDFPMVFLLGQLVQLGYLAGF